jgi:SAM-dependent methyltransferase
MTADARTSYDTVPYPSMPFQQTHPARMAAVARLHGIAATSPNRCRVLELGVGDGANLIPLATVYPESEFIGVDLAPTPVAKGNAVITALGLSNCRLIAADIRTVNDDLGPFDYIIAHGVFSWVPDDVREALLALCQQLLAPNGIAYVSYNAYPGCHVREIYWDLIKFHTHNLSDPSQKIHQARAALEFLAEGLTVSGSLGEYIRDEAMHIARERHGAVIYHDDLAGLNRPFYFHDFAGLAARHGLQFLAEADYSDMNLDAFPSPVAEHLYELGRVNVVLQQQYRDFLKLRRFRQTLLVRNGLKVERMPILAQLRGMAVAVETRPTLADPSLDPGVPVEVKLTSGAAITTDHPLAKAALAVLTHRWPHPLPFEALLCKAVGLLNRADGVATDAELQVLTEVLFAAFATGLLQFYVDPPRSAATAGDRPRLSSYARQQIAAGGDILTNLMHIPVKIDEPVIRQLLWLLDGMRDQQEVLSALAEWAAAESEQGHKLSLDEWRNHYAREIESGLAKAAQLALLVESASG